MLRTPMMLGRTIPQRARRRVAPQALAALGLSAILAIGCSEADRDRGGEPAERSIAPQQIVFIVIDTLRADRLGVYGGPSETAPFLTELAKKSLVFDAAWAPSSWTGPSMASIFTSMYPNQHGVVLGLRGVRKAGRLKEIDVRRLPEALETIPQFMQSQGYGTYGVSSNINVGPIIGFDRGFDRFELILYRQSTGAPSLVERLRSWKSEIQARPRSFVYLHFMDPHPPYVSHDASLQVDPDEDRDNLPVYDGEIRYADDAIRFLFDEFGWKQSATVIISSDHGQEFRDHGGVGHGFQLYSELTRVPLLIHRPGQQASARVERNVTTLDILPTLRQLVGAPPSEQDIGRSLLDAPPDGPDEREIFSMRTDAQPEETERKRALILGNYKLIISEPQDEAELYHLRSDSRELANLAATQPERVQEMRARLDAQARAAEHPSRAAARSYEPSQEEANQLEALGYVEDEQP
jgi:arylsulfatase A-like enzyme